MSFIQNIRKLRSSKTTLILGLEWWKWLAMFLMFYSFSMGFLGKVPALPILHESIRNLYFHVTLWFAMMILLTVSLVYSILYLANYKLKHDMYAAEAVNVSMVFGMLGILTGSFWARFTWGAFWVNDAKLNGATMGMLAYLAYLLLRNSMDEEQKKARIAAVYNIIAYAMFMGFIMVMPRLVDSLHPGNGGNPGFGAYDLNKNMRMVFYPAIIGFTLTGVWIMQVLVRIRLIKQQQIIRRFK